MNKKKELIKNTAIIFLGKFCTQFISFILVPIYTYFLSTEDYGYIDLVQTYFSLIIPIIILRIDSAIFRFLIDCRNNENEKKDLISVTILFVYLQVMISIVILLVLNYIFKFDYFIPILLNMIFISISSVLLQICRGIGDNAKYSISSIISGVVTIILNIIFIVCLKYNGGFVLYSSAIANSSCCLYLFLRLKIYNYVKITNANKKKFLNMIKYSLPMIPDGLSWWIMNVSDRSIISLIIGVSANGIYAVSSKFSNIISSLFQVFNMSWQESASLHVTDDDKNEFFSNILNSTYKVFFSICLFLLVLMPFIFKFIIGKNFFNAYYYVPLLLIGNLYNATANVIGGVYIANKNTASVAKTTVVSALINIVINVIFIKKIGLFAAAVSTLMSYVFLTLFRYHDSKKYVKWNIDSKLLINSTIFYIINCIIYYNCYNIYVNILVFIIVSGILAYFNKEIINMILIKIMKRGDK